MRSGQRRPSRTQGYRSTQANRSALRCEIPRRCAPYRSLAVSSPFHPYKPADCNRCDQGKTGGAILKKGLAGRSARCSVVAHDRHAAQKRGRHIAGGCHCAGAHDRRFLCAVRLCRLAARGNHDCGRCRRRGDRYCARRRLAARKGLLERLFAVTVMAVGPMSLCAGPDFHRVRTSVPLIQPSSMESCTSAAAAT